MYSCLQRTGKPKIINFGKIGRKRGEGENHFTCFPLLCRLIRVSACDQFFYIVTKANNNSAILVSFISQLFSAVEVELINVQCVLVFLSLPVFVQTVAKDHAPTSGEFFRLLARLLNHTHQMHVPIQGVNKLLEVELKWLLNVRVSIQSACTKGSHSLNRVEVSHAPESYVCTMGILYRQVQHGGKNSWSTRVRAMCQ